jgi:hypothetical protein
MVAVKRDLDSQSGNTAGKVATEAQASAILGEQRFLSADRVVMAWNKLIGERRTGHSIPLLEVSGRLPIRYTEETLNTVVEDPAWYLIYDPGFSLRYSRNILGTDPAHQPCHYRGNDWWLSEREDGWASEKDGPAYYLVSMKGLFPLDNPTKHWDWQEEQIHQMGDVFYRAPSRIIANACVSCLLLNNEWHLENYGSFGPEMDASYCFVVTGFNSTGLNFGHWIRNDWGGYFGWDLLVCLARKFDL